MVGQKLSWVGLTVGDFVIKELLGEGSYSWVFQALHTDGTTNRAIKVAKPPEAVEEGGPTGCVPTNAIWQTVNSLIKVAPETEQLLYLQAKKLQSVNDPAVVQIEEVSVRPGSCYYRMPMLSGNNLRQYMRSGPVPIEVLLDVALCLDRLSANEAFRYHGDLKPENLMITPSGVVLIDPGHFGAIDTYKGTIKQSLTNCSITSALYYPLLTPDDVFALGLITWEIACREHPLLERSVATKYDRRHIGDELWAFVQNEEDNGRFFYSSMLGLKRPSLIRPGIPAELEEFLLNCLRIKFDSEGRIDKSPGFATIGDYATALSSLVRKNIRYM